MIDYKKLLLAPTLHSESSLKNWFDHVAEQLLNHTCLLIGDEPRRLVEIEFYYFSEQHPDPFTHRSEHQIQNGRWYFHRSGNSYRGGSFKGVDISIGNGINSKSSESSEETGGILIRGFDMPEGTLVDGPSLCVDQILTETNCQNLAELDAHLEGKQVWDATIPLAIAEAKNLQPRTIYQTARVGLSLKREHVGFDPDRYLLKRYRYLSLPQRTKKGKVLLIMALYLQGKTVDEIHNLTGSPRKSIEKFIANYQLGLTEESFDTYRGKDLSTEDLARLHGIWQTKFAD